MGQYDDFDATCQESAYGLDGLRFRGTDIVETSVRIILDQNTVELDSDNRLGKFWGFSKGLHIFGRIVVSVRSDLLFRTKTVRPNPIVFRIVGSVEVLLNEVRFHRYEPEVRESMMVFSIESETGR